MAGEILTIKDISFELPDKMLFQNVSLSLHKGDKIGIIGLNGSGKSTLLKILAGLELPSKGSVSGAKKAYYLPQIELSSLKKDTEVKAYIENLNFSWDAIRLTLSKLFGIEHIDGEQKISTLSGGEFMQLRLAVAEKSNAEVLLLDEPTNHLDVIALNTLENYLKRVSAYVVVSHDPLFLERVTTRIWEITNTSITDFGGLYSEYQAQKRQEEEARERKLTANKKEVRKLTHSIQKETIKLHRSKQRGEKEKFDGSMSREEIGYFKEKSEKSTPRKVKELYSKKAEKEGSLLENATPKHSKTHLSLHTAGHRGKTLVDIQDASLSIGEKTLLDNINLKILFGDRIVLIGANGSGKTSLLKEIIQSPNPAVSTTGNFKLAKDTRVVYMSQQHEMVLPSKTLVENIAIPNPHLTQKEIREQLSKFLFFEHVNRTADSLSGGELMRLELAIVTASPVDLLILDEPTNNLDIKTLDEISTIVSAFTGALLVVSHNIYFLSKINISRAYIFSQKSLKLMMHDPQTPELFYNEILDRLKQK